ncbi:MAG: hypothetical protein H6825_05905 [Planctomycetes bacterium]|nr:hypothetical protein [Planctomycetota bacterium]
MGRFVIACYRPKPGHAQTLAALVDKHASVLRGEGLITERPAHVMRAADGTFVEVFEWVSPVAVEDAHRNPVVQELWREFGEVCDFVPVGELAEARSVFSEFEAQVG